MPSLRDQLRALQTHPAVRAVVAAGRDGLLIDHAAGGGADVPDAGADAAPGAAEHLAALAPGLVAAAEALSRAEDGSGDVRSVVVELGGALLVALPVTAEVTVLAAVDAGHDEAAAAVGRVRGERGALAEAV